MRSPLPPALPKAVATAASVPPQASEGPQKRMLIKGADDTGGGGFGGIGAILPIPPLPDLPDIDGGAFVKSYIFADPTRLTGYDAMAAAYAAALLAGYWAYFRARLVRDPHGSLPSHFAFQRVMWPRHIWGNSTLKILTIQNIRSALMVVSALVAAAVVSVAAVAPHSLRPWGAASLSLSSALAFTQLRALVPTVILVFSIAHLSAATWAFLTILWLSNCEKLDEATLSTIAEAEGVRHNAARSYAAATALSVQCQDHFRAGWRALAFGLVALLWVRSPLLFAIGMSLLFLSYYHNDFFAWSQTMADEISAMPAVCPDEATAQRLAWQQEVFGAAT